MSRYLARLASRVRTPALAPRAPTAGLEVDRVSVVEAPTGGAPTAATSPVSPGRLPGPAPRQTAPRQAGLERVDTQAPASSPIAAAVAAAPAVATDPTRSAATTAGQPAPSPAIDAAAVLPPNVVVRDVAAHQAPAPRAVAPSDIVAPPSAAPAPTSATPERPAAPPPAHRPAPAVQAEAPGFINAPQRTTASAPLASTTRPTAPPRAPTPEKHAAAVPHLDVHIGSVQLTVHTPAPPPAPRAPAPAPRADAKPAFSAHRHYLRAG